MLGSFHRSNGAEAKLFDISCSYNTKTGKFSLYPLKQLGRHFFITNPVTGTGLSPKWDFSLSTGNPEDFVVGARQAGIPAPTGASDIDWLYLTNIQGTLATEIYRTNTKGGQPPASCTPGDALDVEYSALYWFTK
uniref:Malate dehydrogenase n=1 Tax=Moniliophthora roreri TaxID=221103 RepID=A0A0W0FRI6_MONRR